MSTLIPITLKYTRENAVTLRAAVKDIESRHRIKSAEVLQLLLWATHLANSIEDAFKSRRGNVVAMRPRDEPPSAA